MCLDVLPYLVYHPHLTYVILTLFTLIHLFCFCQLRVGVPVFYPERVRHSYNHFLLKDQLRGIVDFHSQSLVLESRMSRQLTSFRESETYWLRLFDSSSQVGIELKHLATKLTALELEKEEIQRFWTSRPSNVRLGPVLFHMMWEVANELPLLLPKAMSLLEEKEAFTKSLTHLTLDVSREMQAYMKIRENVTNNASNPRNGLQWFLVTPSGYPCDPAKFRIQDVKEIIAIFSEVDEAFDKFYNENELFFTRTHDYLQMEYFTFPLTAAGSDILQLKYSTFPVRYNASAREIVQLRNWLDDSYHTISREAAEIQKRVRKVRRHFHGLRKLYDRQLLEEVDARFKRMLDWYLENAQIVNLTLALH